MSAKNVLITGGDRGIGLGILSAFVKTGMNVFFTYRTNAEKANEIVGRYNSENQVVKCFQLDITDRPAVKAFASSLKKETGTGIDVLVNNAGIVNDGYFLMADFEKWERVVQVNLFGALYVTKQFVMQMSAKRGGSIVNIASVGGLIGIAGQTNYTTAKGGIMSFTKSLSKELARFGVTVNAIAPGYVNTDMVMSYTDEIRKGFLDRVPMGRFAEPEEIGELAVFLASEKARYITGQIITIDGGLI